MKIFWQMILPAFMCIVFFGVLLFSYFIPSLNQKILDQKRENSREMVGTAQELLATYERQVKAGRLTLREAQERALARLEQLRFGQGRQYFWVENLNSIMLMHPFRKDLVGTDVSGVIDSKGTFISQVIHREAEKPGGGFVTYYWSDPTRSGKETPKISYVSKFKSWGWIVGAGVYLDDLELEAAEMTRDMSLAALGVLLLVALAAGYLTLRAMRSDREKRTVLEALLQSEEKFRSIAANAHDGILMLDPRGNISFFNQTAEKIFGYEENEILGKPAKNLLASPDQFKKHLDKVLDTLFGDETDESSGVILELHGRRKNGQDFPLELACSKVNLEGQWYGVVMARDISEKRRADAALMESETKYRTLFESANDIILLLAGDVVVDCNARAAHLLGVAREKIIGSHPDDFATEFQPNGKLSAQFSEEMIRLALDGQPQFFEWLMEKPSGGLIYSEVSLQKTSLFGEDYLLAIVRDITERKEMSQQSERALSLLTAAIEQSPAGILIAQAEGYRLLHANAAAMKLMGMGEGAISSDSIKYATWNVRLLDEQNRPLPRNEEPLWKAVGQGEQTYGKTYIMQRQDGSQVWIEVNAAPVLDADGQIVYAVMVFTNVTERIQAERDQQQLELALRQSQKMEAIGTLAGGIAHDFNNILFAIMGHAELAELKYAQKEDISDLLREVLRAGSRAKDLVQQILTFSRQTEGKKVPVELPPLVKEALKFLRASIPANIEIQQNMDPEGCLVMADPTNLHQVIMNLCTNAAHAMRETGGTLRVEVSKVNLEKEASDGHTGLPPGPYVKLVVSDTGYGIDKQVKERLFDPFFTTKRQGEGTGLGLSVVHGIVKDLGGSIEVESEPGQGATFQVLMPQQQGGVHSEPETVLDDLPRLKGHILLVDDEMGVLNSGQALLEVLGCKVSAFSVSRQALEAFEQSPNDFDVVITDLSMPGMTGLELTRRVKMARPDIPIIMWTGFSDKLNASNFAAYGLDAVLMKPPLISDLAAVLRQAGLGDNLGD